MLEWWDGLQLIQQIFVCVALPATVLMIIQIILLLVGIGGESDFDSGTDADVDTDFDNDVSGVDSADILSVFSFRGIVAMLAVMGWMAVALLGTSLPMWVAISISFVCGLGILFLMGYAMKALSRLQSSGNINVANAIGKVGQVYIPIPPRCSATGKVNITVQEKYTEFTAITKHESTIKTGAYVRVVSVDEAGTLMVEPLVKD